MPKRSRQEQMKELISSEKVPNQEILISSLQKKGVLTNQATVSRDLKELGITKVGGFYQLPKITAGQSSLVELLEIQAAGDNMIVLKVPPGQANAVGFHIDRAQWPEVKGTIAGDDTLFIAVKNRTDQNQAIKKIMAYFK